MRFHRWIEPSYNRVARNRAENRTLAAQRDALLPKLISGELRVKGPAPFLGGVVA
jgi:type I restriction enzyme S subunit